MDAKFYTFYQNNSGGYFIKNDEYGICETIIIQYYSMDDAREKLNNIGKNVPGFDSYCSCCGERWDDCDITPYDTPCIFGIPIDDAEEGWCRKRVFVHYLDGSLKEFKLKKPKN